MAADAPAAVPFTCEEVENLMDLHKENDKQRTAAVAADEPLNPHWTQHQAPILAAALALLFGQWTTHVFDNLLPLAFAKLRRRVWAAESNELKRVARLRNILNDRRFRAPRSEVRDSDDWTLKEWFQNVTAARVRDSHQFLNNPCFPQLKELFGMLSVDIEAVPPGARIVLACAYQLRCTAVHRAHTRVGMRLNAESIGVPGGVQPTPDGLHLVTNREPSVTVADRSHDTLKIDAGSGAVFSVNNIASSDNVIVRPLMDRPNVEAVMAAMRETSAEIARAIELVQTQET